MKMEKVYYCKDHDWTAYDDYRTVLDESIAIFKPTRILFDISNDGIVATIWVYMYKNKSHPIPNQLCQEDSYGLEINRYYEVKVKDRKELNNTVYKMRDYLKRKYKDIKISTNLRGW